MSDNQFTTTLVKQHAHNKARVTLVNTPHGQFTTPAFMPVGTRAAVNCMTTYELAQANSQIILGGNTYHMLVSPGMEFIRARGGMHKMMGWHQPMLTDSGGYQVFSLSQNKKICKIDEQGAHFKHPTSGKVIHMTPKTSIEAQKVIGADIIMAFDECTPEEGGRMAAVAALQRTHRWLLESIETHQKDACSAYGFKQALFGIIQGGSFRDLREESARFITAQALDGFAIGGEVIGYEMEKTCEIISWVEPIIPKDKLRYSMGVGLSPQDLIDVVAQGIDIFDCVAPTRNARHGSLYCGLTISDGNWVKFASNEERGRILIKKSIYANDDRPITEGCDCYTCQNFTRAYLHYLFKENLPLFAPLACIHNVHSMHQTCTAMRECIIASN